MINSLNATAVAERAEIEAQMFLYRTYFTRTVLNATEQDAASLLCEICYSFFQQLVIPFDNIFTVHRELSVNTNEFFQTELPSWISRIEKMSVQKATTNYLWLHQLREGTFEQYLTGYALVLGKKLETQHFDGKYIVKITKDFCEFLMTTLYNALKIHALGKDSLLNEHIPSVNKA